MYTIIITNLFDAGSDEHNVYTTYSQLIDDQEPINNKPVHTDNGNPLYISDRRR